jgi:hypothetical protein
MLQTLINTFYCYPKSQFKTWQKFGGYFAYMQMFANEKQMKIEAEKVRAPPKKTTCKH